MVATPNGCYAMESYGKIVSAYRTFMTYCDYRF